jgi:molecular chaperone GrpE
MAHDPEEKPGNAIEEEAAEAVQAAAGAEGDVAAVLGAATAAQREIADLKSKLLRWQADFQNLQRRAAREVLESRQNADADFAKSMLQVLDHFDMALSVDPERVDAKSLLNGVRITYDELRKILSNRGIEAFDPTGQPFDPHQHEAVMQEPSAQHPSMTVTQTFQQGYRIGDRILRPAKVKVSK